MQVTEAAKHAICNSLPPVNKHTLMCSRLYPRSCIDARLVIISYPQTFSLSATSCRPYLSEQPPVGPATFIMVHGAFLQQLRRYLYFSPSAISLLSSFSCLPSAHSRCVVLHEVLWYISNVLHCRLCNDSASQAAGVSTELAALILRRPRFSKYLNVSQRAEDCAHSEHSSLVHNIHLQYFGAIITSNTS